MVNFSILPKRPRESAHAYSTIWTDEGSPLIVASRRMQEKLQRRLSVPVELAMRYQNPSIEKAVNALAAQGVTETFLIPLSLITRCRVTSRPSSGCGRSCDASPLE